MTIRRPTAQDLRRLAEANSFEISDDEMQAFESMIPGLFESYDSLIQMPEQRPALQYPSRDAGSRPSREDDPYNAILRRCTPPRGDGRQTCGETHRPEEQHQRVRLSHDLLLQDSGTLHRRQRRDHRDPDAG